MNGLSVLALVIAVAVIAYTWHTAPDDDTVRQYERQQRALDRAIRDQRKANRVR